MCNISAAAKTGSVFCPANERGTSSSPTKLVLKSSCRQIMLSVFWSDDNLVSDKKKYKILPHVTAKAQQYCVHLEVCPSVPSGWQKLKHRYERADRRQCLDLYCKLKEPLNKKSFQDAFCYMLF